MLPRAGGPPGWRWPACPWRSRNGTWAEGPTPHSPSRPGRSLTPRCGPPGISSHGTQSQGLLAVVSISLVRQRVGTEQGELRAGGQTGTEAQWESQLRCVTWRGVESGTGRWGARLCPSGHWKGPREGRQPAGEPSPPRAWGSGGTGTAQHVWERDLMRRIQNASHLSPRGLLVAWRALPALSCSIPNPRGVGPHRERTHTPACTQGPGPP